MTGIQVALGGEGEDVEGAEGEGGDAEGAEGEMGWWVSTEFQI